MNAQHDHPTLLTQMPNHRDNDIKDFSDLEPLATLPCLTILKLNGNPVSKLPFYKPRVIAMLSSLGELDDEDVTLPYLGLCRTWARK